MVKAGRSGCTDLYRKGFKTFTHSNPVGIRCTKNGIKEAVMPLSESRSRFTMRFKSKPIRMLQNMDLYNFIEIMGVSWNQAWVTVISH